MKISLLNQRIQLQKSQEEKDSVGNQWEKWENYFSCYATITEGTGQEKTENMGVLENYYINFTVRYCKALEKMTSTEYRVMFQGEIYNILTINHMNYKKNSLKLRCQLVRR